MMLDMLTDVCRKTRPYEINKGETDRVYQQCVDNLSQAIKSGIGSARKAFEQGMKDMAAIPYDRSHLKPKVFITGELLVTGDFAKVKVTGAMEYDLIGEIA